MSWPPVGAGPVPVLALMKTTSSTLTRVARVEHQSGHRFDEGTLESDAGWASGRAGKEVDESGKGVGRCI